MQGCIFFIIKIGIKSFLDEAIQNRRTGDRNLKKKLKTREGGSIQSNTRQDYQVGN